MKFTDLKTFKATAPLAAPDVALRLESAVTCKELSDGTSEFVITTDGVDRMGDTIASEGWQLANFLANPIVLFGHDSHSLPVGKAVEISHVPHGLKARVEWVPKEVYGFAGTVKEMVKGGFLNAVSVGFQPLEYKWSDDKERPGGIDFTKQELLEFSIVPIPANAEALVQARSAGIDTTLIREWAAKWLQPATEEQKEVPSAEIEEKVENLAPDAAEQRIAKLEEVANKLLDTVTQLIAAPAKESALDARLEKLESVLGKMAARIDALTATSKGLEAKAESGLSDEEIVTTVVACIEAHERKSRGQLPEDF